MFAFFVKSKPIIIFHQFSTFKRSFSSLKFSASTIRFYSMENGKMATKIEQHFPSLKIGSEKLRNAAELSVPAVPEQILKIEIDGEHEKRDSTSSTACMAHAWQRGAPIPTAVGPLVRTRVVRNACISQLAPGRIHKPKWELELELDERDKDAADVRHALLANCDAGDSFNVLFENPREEVDFLLQRLSVSSRLADTELHLALTNRNECNGKFAHLPAHCSPRKLLSQFVDIRRAPARVALRALSEHAREPVERRRLLELASAQGSAEFTRFVRQPNISLAELLCEFPSVSPPLEWVIEFLPRLLPRHYTLASFLPASHSAVGNALRFRFVYSVLELPSPILEAQPEFAGLKRYGACTQWLLQLRPGDTVQLIQKEASKFRLLPPPMLSSSSFPADENENAHLLLSTPLVMVGPGTGCAPFIAFLQKIRYHLSREEDEKALEKYGGKRVKRILIYASSNLEDEFLFKSELEQLLAEGVLSTLVACESRPAAVDGTQMAHPTRIYDALRAQAADVADILDNDKDGLFYACGDVKNMSRELWQCLSQILQAQKGFTPVEAIERLKQLRDRERLIEDVWS